MSLPLVVALRRGSGPAAFQVRRYLAGRGEVPLDLPAVHALLEETSAPAVCLRLARWLCQGALTATERHVQTDGLQLLVGALLDGLRDTVEQ